MISIMRIVKPMLFDVMMMDAAAVIDCFFHVIVMALLMVDVVMSDRDESYI